MFNFHITKNQKLLFLVTFLVFPTLSQADYCADMKERYWKCVRSSMTNEKCADGDNFAIPAECLNAGSSSPQNSNSSTPTPPKWDFLNSKKESKNVVSTESKSQKSVKIINLKSLNNRKYLESEDDVNEFISNTNEVLLNAIKEGKKIRLQYQ
ncbi:MAG: hypothetical protein WBI40_12965 [Methylococcaceae bacterium]